MNIREGPVMPSLLQPTNTLIHAGRHLVFRATVKAPMYGLVHRAAVPQRFSDTEISVCSTYSLGSAPGFRMSRWLSTAVPRAHQQAARATASATPSPPPSVTTKDSNRSPSLKCSLAAITRKGLAPGYKDHNQDSCLVVSPFLAGDHYLFGVADGHGIEGHLVSEAAKKLLPGVLMNQMLLGKNPADALKAAIEQVDQMVSGNTHIDTINSGSTLVLSLLRGKQLTTAWIGDSRAVVGTRVGPDGDWSAKALSQDHKPDSHQEHTRITAAGGRVEQTRDASGRGVGPHRVWLPHMDYPGLAMSRAIGDTCVKHVGVTATPDVVTHKVGPHDQFLVLASDGVWEHMSNEQVVRLVGSALERARVSQPDTRQPRDQDVPRATPGLKRMAAAGVSGAAGTTAHHVMSCDVTDAGQTAAQHDSKSKAGNTPQPSSATGEAAAGAAAAAPGVFAGGLRAQPLHDGLLHEDDFDEAHHKKAAMHACTELVEAARDRWLRKYRGSYVDDITAVVVAFTHVKS